MPFILGSLIISFFVGMLFAPFVITPLRKFVKSKNNQADRPLTYKLHKSKAGTPSMGGLIFIIPILIATPFFAHSTLTLIGLLGIALFAFLGGIDDFLNTLAKQGDKKYGLTPISKFILQLVFSSLIAILLYNEFQVSTVNTYIFGEIHIGIWMIPLTILALISTTNAVNITDGLDGLASGLSVFVFLGQILLLWKVGQTEGAVFAGITTGFILAFLWYNIFPARVFMGDTGSLVLGMLIVYFAYISGTLLLIPLISGVFVLEILSVILQLTSKKFFGKKLFSISPIHHHYENKGWHEMQVVMRMWLAEILFVLFTLYIFFL